MEDSLISPESPMGLKFVSQSWDVEGPERNKASKIDIDY